MMASRQIAHLRLALMALLCALGFLAALPAAQAQSAAAAYTTGYRWDAMRRLVGEISPSATAGGTSGPFIAVRYTYDADGQLTSTEKGTLSAWQAESVLPANWTGFTVTRVTVASYDAVGNKLQETVGAGTLASYTTYGITQYAYDANDRVTCTTVRLNLSAPPADACTLGTAGSQGNDRVTKNVYDAAGQVVQVRKAVGTAREQAYVTYSYTQNGKQQYVIDANGNKAQLTWDGYDRQSQWIFPSPTALTSTAITNFNAATPANALTLAGSVNTADYEQYGYDANGNRTSLRKRDGSTLSYTFDALNRMTLKTVPSRANLPTTHSRSVSYAYDLRGLMTSAQFTSPTVEGIATQYDKLGRITASTIAMDSVSRSLTYQYDANGNRTQVTWPDAAYAQYGYDGLNRASTVAANASDWTKTYGYSNDGDLTSDSVGPSPSTSSYASTLLGRDAIGRLSSIGRDVAGGASFDNTLTFGYNNASQIVSESRTNDSYAYTARVGGTKAYTTNGLNQYSSITASSTNAYCYDANGNLTSDGVSVYLYDIENRLVEKHVQGTGNSNCAALSYAGQPQAILRYDPMGRLYETSVGTAATTTRFLTDGDAMVAEYDSVGAMLRRYVHGADGKSDDPIAWYEGAAMTNGAVRYLYANHQGTIVLAADADGASASQFKYDEYGNAQMAGGIAGCTGSIAVNCGGRFLYTGQALIPELAMYYYKARIYSPALGRFMQVDPIAYDDNQNLYSYVGNNPVNLIDRTGKRPEVYVQGNNVRLVWNVVVKGGGTSEFPIVKSQVEGTFSGQIGKYNVTSEVNKVESNQIVLRPTDLTINWSSEQDRNGGHSETILNENGAAGFNNITLTVEDINNIAKFGITVQNGNIVFTESLPAQGLHTSSHEFGHDAGLTHVQDTSNLMDGSSSPPGNRSQLTEGQITQIINDPNNCQVGYDNGVAYCK